MASLNGQLAELRERLARISDLAGAARVLGWDQQTMMPRLGAPARAEQLATLERVLHEEFTAPRVGELLDELLPLAGEGGDDSDDAALVRVTARDYEKAVRVPSDLSAELSRAASIGQQAWVAARAASDFDAFRPHLERNIALKREYVACFEPAAEDYDILLDDYEHGTTAAEVRAVFDRLKERLVPLIAAVAERRRTIGDVELPGPFATERQTAVVASLLARLGFDAESWRIDLSAHPFATSFSASDVRLTTRYLEHGFEGLFGAMHEFGHGLYERGCAPELERTPLAGGVSLGLHESQSRLWENLVGRSLPFWRGFYPELRETFPELGTVALPEFYRAVNEVRPSLIRVEADEVTYNLHIILRFELEQELLAGRIEPADLPEAWNAAMDDYLGVVVPDDARGVLQDIHWSAGIFGYFPTYSLGNVMSVQIWEAARRDLPELESQVEALEFAPLREWLREKLHRHGRRRTPKETLAHVTGGPIDPEPYLAYLEAKVGALYDLPG